MRQKVTNGDVKKRFILYKGHTGWKIKTRIFGSLLISFSAFAVAESIGNVDVHAAAITDQTTMSNGASESPTPTKSSSTAQVTTQASTQQTTVSQATAQQPSTQQSNVTQDATSDAKYPVLSQNQNVDVGADTSQVELTSDQVAGHFTASVENRNSADKDNNASKNIVTQPIGSDGSISLTTNDYHNNYSSSGTATSLQGHQAAHVSFEHEIDFSHNFSMSGALGIGSKTSGGADSVGFIFAPGDPSEATKGGSGGLLGLGGLSNAFGFVFDEYGNSNYYDPTTPYVGWRTTDSSGNLQKTSSGDYKSATSIGLKRSSSPINDFTMNYDASTQMLTVVLSGQTFSRKINDISTGYSLSVSASTGGNCNDYSAKIDNFSYTPKTIPLTVNLVDSADSGALLDNTNVKAVANIGDTISIFSTQEAAARAVAIDHVDPSLVAVIPADSAGNIYLIDGDQVVANNNGTVHYIGGDTSIGDSAYYSYTVTDADNQSMTVPVRLAFTAQVTPVDSKTNQPIAGLQPVTVVAVAGKPVLVQIPGYTATKVTLAAPTDGSAIAQDTLPIDQGTTSTDSNTTTDTSQPIGHYYTGTGKTIDGQTVIDNVTVGTGQSISDDLSKQTYQDAKGNPINSGGKTGINSDDYYWSDVGNANATDSLDETKPQASDSILLPTTATLDYWEQQATTNQTNADNYKQQAQTMYDSFVGLSGLTADQKTAADQLLQSVVDIYAKVSDTNGKAKTAFESAKTATVANDIFNDGQTGYTDLEAVKNLLISFQDDLGALKTTNQDAQNSLATFSSWQVPYGTSDIGHPTVSFGQDFGTVSNTQTDEFFNDPTNYQYFTFEASGSSDTPVTPKDAGQYIFKLTDSGRANLKSWSTSDNAGLYVSGVLTITPKDVVVNTNNETVIYGDTPTLSGDLDSISNGDNDFEIFDNSANKVVTASQLQAGGNYSIRYTAQAQADLKKNDNYNITAFNTGVLTVTPRPLTVKAPQNIGKTYGDTSEPAINGTTTDLVNGDTLNGIGVKLVRAAGENAGKYTIDQDASSKLSSNYTVKIETGTFIIAKKPVEVTAANSSKVYGGDDPTEFALTPDSSSVLMNGDSIDKLGVTLTRATGEDVGDYAINGSATNSQNYDVTVDPGIFTINKAPVTITIDPISMTYGDTPTFTDKIDTSSATLEQNDFEIVDKSGNVVSSNLQVGEEYTVKLKPGVIDNLNKTNTNYSFTEPEGAKLTVDPRSIVVTAGNADKKYGESDPNFTLTSDSAKELVNNDTLAQLGVVLKREAGENVGTYSIGLDSTSSTVNKNYDIKVNPGTFTINVLPITVKAADNGKIYGQTDPELALTSDSAAGLVNNDDLSKLGIKLIRDDGEKAGSYMIKLDPSSILNKNYQITVDTGIFTIDPAGAEITIAPTEVTYGDTPKFDSFININGTTNSLEQSDYEVVDPDNNIVDSDLQVGTDYSVRLKSGALDKLHVANPNYNFAEAKAAKLTVVARPIIVTADNASKYYGSDDPTNFTLTSDSANGLVNGDTVAQLGIVLKREAGENVGTYSIDMDSTKSKLNKNYTFTINSGTFSIAKKSVIVTAADNSKIYGDKDPDLVLTDDSKNVLVPGDTIDKLGVTLTRVVGESVGDYAINSSSINSQNYDVKVNAGKFTIKQAGASSTIQPVTVVYGETPNFVDTVSVGKTTFAQSDFEVIDPIGNVVNTTLQAGEDYYRVRLTDTAIARLKSENPNYDFGTITPAKLNVEKRPVTILIDNQNIYKGDDEPQNKATVKNPKIGDDNLISTLNLNYDEPDSSTVGTYDITASSSDPNYDVTVIPGKLTILGRDVDKDGNVTITEKDKDGNVVKITKQWNDDGNKETVYVNDPKTGTKTVTESNDGKTLGQQTVDPSKKTILPDNDGAATVVIIDDSGEPNIIHYQSDPDKDGLTSADELIKYETDPLNPDSDGDGINDGDEVKNHTDPLVPNYPDTGDTAKVVMKNQTVGTTTQRVKLYDKDGKLIADRILGVNTDWRSDEEYTLNDILYYRVSTNEFVRASDVYLYFYQSPTLVRVYNNEIGNLIDYTGSPVSRSLKPSSEWKTDRIAVINGQNYYRVSTNEFVPVEKVYEYLDSDTDITTDAPTTVYDERGSQTGVLLPANAAYKVDKVVVINGVVYYRVSTNEFIKVV
ncbi:MBG domain-containing protein [Companilactobacillus keshanensis]|uniref:MBG domain-containing protein n=1 Tax=Companilactobacillus keshanensis TaxID=2486003 RepID=A0ABW4BSR9_9LACO|nr:MBG domain-containing protein [Companilactobacillus keshanensis]